ncbi:hypothetical protein [Streptomyces vietnamensis]|uniref:Uncharacterized protein n=1 Tax=Streptomyces vietnamensis TaxID=362257 RepID=A0A0B5IE20_9ACTN|nr:hypothetical protein [Streptomyces vietnamensis]AJF66619.1 hypothetical protein SVTN_21850 [Streptomyces vietnamensis]
MGATVPFGVAAIAMGVAAFRTGWMIPPARRSVRRPRVYGVGATLVGTGLLVSVATYFLLSRDRSDDVVSHPWLAFTGNAVELVGIAFVLASRLHPRHGRAPHPAA